MDRLLRQDFAGEAVHLHFDRIVGASFHYLQDPDGMVFPVSQLTFLDCRAGKSLEDKMLRFVLGDFAFPQTFVFARAGGVDRRHGEGAHSNQGEREME